MDREQQGFDLFSGWSIFFSISTVTLWLQTGGFNAMSYATKVPGPFLPPYLFICPRVYQVAHLSIVGWPGKVLLFTQGPAPM